MRLFDRMLSLVRFPLLVVILVLLAPQTIIAGVPIQNTLTRIQGDGCQANQTKIQANIAELPLSFIANAGQADANVRFMVKAGKQTIFFTPQEVVFAASEKPEGDDKHSSVVRLRFVGANGEVEVERGEPLPGVTNFFLGNDPEQWRANVSTYAAITYRDLYPGIDLIYSGKQGRLKSEFVVAAGADPTVIIMDYGGVSSMYVREDGTLVLETPIGELVEAPPLIYQMIGEERVTVEGGYRLLGNGEVAFTLGNYDLAVPLIIDPTLDYSTYLGGSDVDMGIGIAVDSSGSVYITGWANSYDFPTQNPLQTSNSGIIDAFVAKLSPSGSALLYSTYLGGSDNDYGIRIVIDGLGNAYIVGRTWSLDFPMQNALQPDCGGGEADAFVAKLSSSGSALIYSTYLGGNSWDEGNDIAVDGSGNAYVTGDTSSTDFPMRNALQPDYGGGERDAFVAKLSTTGSTLVYSTYLGGSQDDRGYGIAGDSLGNAYIAGETDSANFPTRNPLQPNYGGPSNDAFIAKLDASGSMLVYSTYLGGSADDGCYSIAVDGSGSAYITGRTTSTNFPTKNPLQPNLAGELDAFVAKLSPSGSALVYSTYLGGSNLNIGYGIAVDGSGNAYVTGPTQSNDFPTQNPLQPEYGGGSADAFIAKLSPSGSAILYSTYLGGNSWDEGIGIAVDNSGNVYITGDTASTDFPTQNPLQPNLAGYSNAFVVKIGEKPANIPPETKIVDASISGNTATFTWSGSDDTTPAAELTYSYRLVRPGPAYDAWSSWSSGKTKKYTDLSPGNYKFQVRARDAEMAIDPSPASREFTIGEGALKCASELRKQDTSTLINTIDINKPFDIYVGASTGNPEQVRFSSDESQDGTPTGEWTDWYDWDVSSGDWDANTKTTAWSFATSGKKEVWAEIKDSNGSTGWCHANIFVHPGYAIVTAGQGGWREKRGLDHSANNAYRALRNLGFDDNHILYLNSVLQEIDGRNVVDMPASPDSLRNALDEIRDRVGENPTPLILYLTGHGFEDQFDFDPEGPLTTILDASTFRGMLADFPASRMFIMIGSCYSGSFITIDRGNNDSISAKERIIVTGAHNDETRVLLGWVRSSDCFWGDLIRGLSIKDAYARRTLPGDKRHLWLDDNGDAVGHPPHALGDDGAIAAVTKIGTPGSDDLELKPWIFYWIRSPGELSVYDTQGRVTGLVNGEVKEEIPDSLYDEANGLVALFSPSGSYYCQVVGTGEGSYGLEVSSIEGGEAATFAATSIPTTSGATHKYTVDWDALARGEEGVTLQVDNDGDGTFEETIKAGLTLDGTTTPIANQPPDLSILVPVREETITSQTYQVQWQATDPDTPASSLSIDLFYSTNGGATWVPITSNEANDSFYDWDISRLQGGEYWLKIVAEDPEGGTSEATVGPFTISVFEGNIIVGPNPVTGAGTAFFYTLPAGTSTAKLMILNVAGKPLFETSLDVSSTRFPSAGTWNPVDQDGVPLANGPYVYVLIADGRAIGQGKMVIQR